MMEFKKENVTFYVFNWLPYACEKGEMTNTKLAWNKKIWDPDRDQSHDIPNTGRSLFSLSYE